MELFRVLTLGKKNIICIFFICFLQSCATHHSQFGSRKPVVIHDNFDNPKTISHTFYLIGDAGNWDNKETPEVFSLIEKRLIQADTNSTLLFLGDNIYPKGMPPQNSINRKSAEMKLEKQLVLTRKFKGKTIFIPGNHDWYSGLEGLKEEERWVNEYLKKKRSFLPENSCPIETVSVNEKVALIVIDSQWSLEKWDKHPTINEGCTIKTREQFFIALEKELNTNQSKTILLALHHPLMTNASYGFSLERHIFPLGNTIPLPIIGSLIYLIQKTSGISSQDIQNKKYNTFVKRIKTLIRDKGNIVVVSGHDHNLQYIDNEGIRQIISGAGSKKEAVMAVHENDFSFGNNGYAVLEVLKNGASKVSFYGADSKGIEALLFRQQPVFAQPKPNLREFPNAFPKMKDTAVYSSAMTTKGRVYRFLWGNHYRKQYSLPVRVRQASLDTLYGGLTPSISSGGNQSRLLKLSDQNGKEYVMQALKKSATHFLQSVAFKDQSVEKDFMDTYAEKFIMDFYTTSHPYTPLAVAQLAGKVGVNHTNPALYFVPKQNRLALFNENFGDELYLMEQHPTNEMNNGSNFGKPFRILNTEEVLANLQTDEKYAIDEYEYIKARLFDMLIGDWNRNPGQWRWGEFNENNKVIYRPIPLGRDQAFSKYDGMALKIVVNIPVLRHMKSFDKKLKNVKWFNREAYNLDLALLTHSKKEDWLKQAKFIEKNLSDADIDQAFENLPKEMKDATIAKIKSQLKIRKTHLQEYAKTYYEVLQKTVLIVGTAKNNRFVITRKGTATEVQVFNETAKGKVLMREMTYKRPETKEIWVYGLGGEDIFELKGEGRKRIKLRLLGGSDQDTYEILAGKKALIYDFKSKESNINNPGKAKLVFSDSYEVNAYDYEKPKYNVFAGYPLLGFNPDDGLKIGAVANYTVNGFERYPYTQRHSVNGNYFFATNGYELSYKGNFPHVIGKWNLNLDLLYTSPNFSINFFGFGNETSNFKNADLDYNRVKMRTLKASPSLQWIGEQGASAIVQAAFERVQVDNTEGRFIVSGVVLPNVFDYKNFVDLNLGYKFENYDNQSNPTMGMTFAVMGGYKINTNETGQQFPYAESELGFNYRLSPSGKWILATLLNGKVLFNNKYEFYQAATVGGDSDLRGFRNQRFSGKHSFYQSTDIRLNLGKLQNGFVPLSYGVFGGFDYGRVWLKDDTSEKWHQSVGGGLWLNGVNLITTKLSYFYSGDGGRISFGLGFGF